jgi:hypothetical protein
VCVHSRIKFWCRDCGGKGICVHGKNKYLCKDCGGSGICGHGRNKHNCKECVYIEAFAAAELICCTTWQSSKMSLRS